MKKTIGFIGLGVMGAGMARNVAEAGFDLVVTTRSPDKADIFRKIGACVAENPAELAARCDVIVTCVPDASALRALVEGESGLAAGRWDNGLLIDCSTIAPFETTEIARALAKAGASVIDAPVSGGAKGADSGTLTIMCGGAGKDFERARDVLQAMGKNIHHVGPLGAGQAVKACNQLMVSINMMGVFEAIGLARAAGVDPKVMREVLSTGAARSGVLEAHALRYLDDSLQPGFRAELMRKDLGIANAVGSHFNITQPATNLAHQMLIATCNNGHAGLDSAAMGLLYETLNGLSEGEGR
ncbi:NAD(P)-dependent oxidoreductase [Pararhizobium haloflavum]|uniref:NAD(P)-dependent oxidoreductase n=1 Tax=Pararhizobium haloflavum TaxID=2037914 RepID=UPI000C1A20FC|nr:NAD(P)-dependent oxidoreductase [Pararhizobium haloflavum]